MYEFIDSHCHFDFNEFDRDRESLWLACKSSGITGAIIPGVDPLQWGKAAKLSHSLPGIYHAVGLHPWWIKAMIPTPANLTRLRQQLMDAVQSDLCVAIGECGLDGMVETPLPIQQHIFDLHLQVANDVNLPVIVHCRKAHNEVINSLQTHKLKRGGVIHGFSGSSELARQYWDLGFYLGVGGTITYERAKKTRAAVKNIPLDAILLETDSPDMPLSGQQGQRNSPHNIPVVAQVLAQLRAQSLEVIAAQTTTNTKKLFGLNIDNAH